MKKLQIFENEPLKLDTHYLNVVEDMILKDNSLPIYIENNTVFFSAYTVGNIQVEDLIIEILPRNPAITLDRIFEMILFINSNSIKNDYKAIGFDYTASFGVDLLTRHFILLCKELVNVGLTGTFISQCEISKMIRGNIKFENYIHQLIPYRGVYTDFNEYSINTPSNQIIKSALLKVMNTYNIENFPELSVLLREFNYIDEYRGSYDLIEDIVRSHFSTNPAYPLTLEYAIKILKDLKLTYKNGKIKWSSFLQNSNTIFEKYVRKILDTGLVERVSKWEIPKEYAILRYNNKVGNKSFSPDILIDYDHMTSSCKAILDVKNKRFYPNSSPLSDIVDASDIYQILFYCRRLNTNLGGLIYPTSKDIDPIRVMIDDESELNLYLFSVNMSNCFQSRHTKLVNQVKNYLLISS